MAYEKNVWTRGDLITAVKLNHIEDGIEDLGKTKADIDGVYPKLVAGDLVESETKDDVFTYQVTDHTGKANINSIKGNTLIWNQLENATASRTHVGITYTASNGKLSVNGTATGASYWKGSSDGNIISLIQGHKYLVSLGNSSYTGSGSTYGWYFTVLYKNFFQNSEIYTAPSSQNVKLNFTVASGQTIDMEFIPQVFDLTQMFGAGNEPTSVDEFTKLYPLPYYQYNAGELLSFNGTGIKATNADSSVEETLSLPIATYFPNGMEGVGTYYDEMTNVKATTRMTRVDLGTLNWNYRDAYNGFFYSTDISGVVALSNEIACSKYDKLETINSTTISNSNKVICINTSSGATGLKNIILIDRDYTDPNLLKQSLSGVYLVYPLETPTEEDVDLDLSYNTYEGGTEQLLPVNTDVPVTSPISMNVEFDFGENLNARLNKMLSCLAQVETSPSTHNYSVGDYLMYEYQLYKVTSAITTGQSLTVGTNITATTVMSELLSLTA